MALIESAMVSFITGQVSNFKLYPEVIPQGVTGVVGTYTVDGTDYVYNTSGYGGQAVKHYMIKIRSTVASDIYTYADNIRLCLQGYSGTWGTFRINEVIVNNLNTDSEQPSDGSQNWLFWATLQISVRYQEPKPNFG
jgi:hypothetical protein